jgi:hypothetical protein
VPGELALTDDVFEPVAVASGPLAAAAVLLVAPTLDDSLNEPVVPSKLLVASASIEPLAEEAAAPGWTSTLTLKLVVFQAAQPDQWQPSALAIGAKADIAAKAAIAAIVFLIMHSPSLGGLPHPEVGFLCRPVVRAMGVVSLARGFCS